MAEEGIGGVNTFVLDDVDRRLDRRRQLVRVPPLHLHLLIVAHALDHAIGVDAPSGVVKVIEGELELVENDGLAVVLGLPLVQRLGEAEEQVG